VEIRRITHQSEPLVEHYSRLANDPRTSPDFSEFGRRMLELLERLPSIEGPPVWALTSHSRLALIARDDWRQRSLVMVAGCGLGELFGFSIEYSMPDDEAPWPGAVVRVGTHDVLQACEMIAYGLAKATGVKYSFRRPVESDSRPLDLR
jgi:hypothetical protein